MDNGVMDKILVVDFGSQYAHLIAQAIRRIGVYAQMIEPDAKTELFNDPAVKGIVWSGGPASVYAPDAPAINPEVFTKEWILSRRIPFLFTCYGHQLAAQIFAQGWYAAVEKKEPGEYGPTPLTVRHPIGILEGLNAQEVVLMSHEDSVVRLPPDFMITASTENCPSAAVQHISAPLFGIQFHAEVSHTPSGTRIFENFLAVCSARKEWTPQRMFEETREILRNGIRGRIGILLA
jgi:GMP synthase (glutamine-hydrolysing)